jgi:hypothetical protein
VIFLIISDAPCSATTLITISAPLETLWINILALMSLTLTVVVVFSFFFLGMKLVYEGVSIYWVVIGDFYKFVL